MRERLHTRRSRPVIIAATLATAGLSVAGIAVAGQDDPAPAPAPVHPATADDMLRAEVLRQVARWAIDNGYTGLSPVSLRPVERGTD
jgi:hypothetical protein